MADYPPDLPFVFCRTGLVDPGGRQIGYHMRMPASSDHRQTASRLLRSATMASVAVAMFLVMLKLVAFYLTDSVAMLATLVDSMLDTVASLLNLYAVHHSLTPADQEHRFGHGKAESLAGLAQGAIISGSAVFLLLTAGERLLHPLPISHSRIGIIVMLISIALTLALVFYQRFVISKTDSVAIAADSLHYLSDVLVNVSVIVALILSDILGWTLADPIFGLCVAGYIIYSAWQIVRQSLDHLMDHELPDDERAHITRIVLSHPEVCSLHDLRTRASGQDQFIQFHLEMDGQLSLLDAHRISDEVEAMVREAFPQAEVIIHEDPVGLERVTPE